MATTATAITAQIQQSMPATAPIANVTLDDTVKIRGVLASLREKCGPAFAKPIPYILEAQRNAIKTYPQAELNKLYNSDLITITDYLITHKDNPKFNELKKLLPADIVQQLQKTPKYVAAFSQANTTSASSSSSTPAPVVTTTPTVALAAAASTSSIAPKSTNAEKIARLTEEIKTTQEEITTLEEENKGLDEGLESIANQRIKTRTQKCIADNKIRIEKLDTNLALLRTDRQSLEEEVKASTAVAAASTSSIAPKSINAEKIARLTEEIKTAQEEKTALEEENKALADGLELIANPSIKSLTQTSIADNKIRIEELDTNLALLRTTRQSLEEEVKDSTAAMEKIQGFFVAFKSLGINSWPELKSMIKAEFANSECSVKKDLSSSAPTL